MELAQDQSNLSILHAFASLIIVVGLMVLMGLAFRYFSGQKALSLSPQKRRLKISEVKSIDHKHKLAIVQCDEKEHLVLISAAGTPIVVDSNLCVKDTNEQDQRA